MGLQPGGKASQSAQHAVGRRWRRGRRGLLWSWSFFCHAESSLIFAYHARTTARRRTDKRRVCTSVSVGGSIRVCTLAIFPNAPLSVVFIHGNLQPGRLHGGALLNRL